MSELEPTRTYSNPTATEILRRLLDERGVEWGDDGYTTTCTVWVSDGVTWHGLWRDDCIELIAHLTPEQAITATLGTGTCKRVMDSIDPFAMWVCDHCGHPLDTSENFCGGCGRKVVSE